MGFSSKRTDFQTVLRAAERLTPNLNSAALVRERTIPSDRRLSAQLVPTFEDRGCHVVSAMDPYGRILGLLDRSRCFSF
jgi:CBS-domain-containing membrane protein